MKNEGEKRIERDMEGGATWDKEVVELVAKPVSKISFTTPTDHLGCLLVLTRSKKEKKRVLFSWLPVYESSPSFLQLAFVVSC